MPDYVPSREPDRGPIGAEAPPKVDDVRRRVLARAENLPRLRHELDVWAERIGLPEAERHALVLASYEAMSNVVSHAYVAGGVLDLHATHVPADGYLEVTVTDHGQWRPPDADLGPLSGRGLMLMHAMAETTIDSTDDGTTVRMQWPCPGAS